jgi:multisubunit Na+/H+ antiporter MnhG subunit
VAEAMETRGFPSRWRRRKYVFSFTDYLQIAISTTSVAVAVTLSLYGIGLANYYVPGQYAVQLPIVMLFVLLTFPFVPYLRRRYDHSDKGSEVQLQFE